MLRKREPVMFLVFIALLGPQIDGRTKHKVSNVPGLADMGVLSMGPESDLSVMNLGNEDSANLVISKNSMMSLRDKSRLSLADSSRLTIFDKAKLSVKRKSRIYLERTNLTLKNVEAKLRNFARMFAKDAVMFVARRFKLKNHSVLTIGMEKDPENKNDSTKRQPSFVQVNGRFYIKNESTVRQASSDSSIFLNTSGGISVIRKSDIYLDSGAKLELHDHSYLEVWDNSSLRLGANAKLIVIGESWLRIDYNSRITIQDEARCLVLHSYADYRMVDRQAVLPRDRIHGFYCNENIRGMSPWTFWFYQIETLCNSSSTRSFCQSEFLRQGVAQHRATRRVTKWQYSLRDILTYRKLGASTTGGYSIVAIAILVLVTVK